MGMTAESSKRVKAFLSILQSKWTAEELINFLPAAGWNLNSWADDSTDEWTTGQTDGQLSTFSYYTSTEEIFIIARASDRAFNWLLARDKQRSARACGVIIMK